MTIENLAICTLPSIVAFAEQEIKPVTTKNRRKTVDVISSKDAIQYKNVSNALSMFIQKRNEFKKIPGELLENFKFLKKKKNGKDLLAPLKDTGDVAGLREFVANLFKVNHCYLLFLIYHFKEYETGWKNWQVESITNCGILVASRDVKDTCPLKSYRIQVTVPASIDVVFRFIFNERKQWDRHTIASKRTHVDWDHKEDLKKVVFNTGLARKDTLIVR